VLQFHGDGGFARGGEPGEPDCEAALVAEGAALGAGDGAGVVGDVSIDWDWVSEECSNEGMKGSYVAIVIVF
jgi:hypothetical protein